MLEVIWVLFCLGIILYILVLLIRASKLMRREYGRVTSIIFGLAILLSVLGKYGSSQSITRHLKRVDQELTTNIEVSPIHDLKVRVYLDTINNDYDFYTKLSCQFGSIVIDGPITWEFRTGYLRKCEEGYSYHITGIKKWNLLSFSIYSEEFEQKGQIDS